MREPYLLRAIPKCFEEGANGWMKIVESKFKLIYEYRFSIVECVCNNAGIEVGFKEDIIEGFNTIISSDAELSSFKYNLAWVGIV